MKKQWQAGGSWHGRLHRRWLKYVPIYPPCLWNLGWYSVMKLSRNMYSTHCKCYCLDYFCPFLLAKVRRLYDIANVLTSLGLIKKVHVTEERGRKPAFKWIGPVEFPGKTGNLCSLHLCSFCFDSPFPSRKRWFCMCKEWLGTHRLSSDY